MLASIKRFIKKSPKLYSVCLKIYHLTFGALKRSLARQRVSLRNWLIQRPHLLLYAKLVKDILRGDDILSNIKLIFKQLRMDFLNLYIPLTNQLAIKSIYYETMQCCIQHNNQQWWKSFPDYGPRVLPSLQRAIREYILKQEGDYKAFLELSRKVQKISSYGAIIHESFFDNLAMHFSDVLDAIDRGELSKDIPNNLKHPMVLGVSVWGNHYLDMMIKYCLPSLLTDGNLGALCKEREVVLFIHTNEAGKEYLDEAPITQTLKQKGIYIVYRILDKELLLQISEDPNHKYWHLGMVQSIDLYFSKFLKADYHLLMPDVIYSENHFAGMLKAVSQGHKIITRICFSTKQETVAADIEKYRKNNVLSIPAADVTVLGIKHMHTFFSSLLLTNKDINTELPNVHVLAWEGKDSMQILSPHQTILYLDREFSEKLPKRYYTTLDSELDKIIPKDAPIYTPKAEDGMQLIEISPESMRAPEMPTITLDQFCDMFWRNSPSLDYWKFFAEDVVDPINREALPNRPYMDDKAIEKTKKHIREKLLSAQPKVSIQQKEKALALLNNPNFNFNNKKLSDNVTQIRDFINNHPVTDKAA